MKYVYVCVHMSRLVNILKLVSNSRRSSRSVISWPNQDITGNVLGTDEVDNYRIKDSCHLMASLSLIIQVKYE